MKKAVVVGAGVSGLAAAVRLCDEGYDVTVLESAHRAGGVLQTSHVDGFLVENGPHALNGNQAEVNQIISRLALDKQVTPASHAAKRRYIVKGSKLVPLPASPVGLLTTSLLSARGKATAALEPFVSRRKGTEETVSDFFRRRLGEEVLEYAVDPFVAGIFAGDPDRLSLQWAFPKLHRMESEFGSIIRAQISSKNGKRAEMRSFKGGLETLVLALTKTLGRRLNLGRRVSGLRPGTGGEWHVDSIDANGTSRTDQCEAVILTNPPWTYGPMAGDVPSLHALSLLEEIHYSPVATVSLGFRREDVGHPLDGFGLLVPRKEKFEILGTLFPSTIFPDRAPEGHVLLTTFVGGMRQPRLTRQTENNLASAVIGELRHLLRITGTPVMRHVCCYPHAIPQYELGYGRHLSNMEQAEAANPGLYLAGNFRDGTSLCHSLASGWSVADRIQAND